MSSNEHGRVHRNLQSAFGPYTSRQLSPMPEPHHPHDVIVMLGCVVAAAVAFAVLVLL